LKDKLLDKSFIVRSSYVCRGKGIISGILNSFGKFLRMQRS